MKKFEILRYLKRFSVLIFLLALVGSATIYMYANNKQEYTASVIIRYTNSGISDGLTPDGSKLDVNEIYSSAVISQAMDSLGLSGKLSSLRSSITVKPVIDDDQQKINDALLEKGEESTYFPDTYRISLVVSGKEGSGYARNMLDAILQSYCTYYTEKYVEQKLSLNPSSNLLANGYDYYECVRILENDTNDMLEFLRAKRDNYPDFRSSKTGYTFADLCATYSEFKKYVIPELYAKVLDGPQVRDQTVLKDFLANNIADANQSEEVNTSRRDELERLISEYVVKNAGLLESYFTEGGDTVSSNYILNDIETAGAGQKAVTTYDNLVLELVDIDKQIAGRNLDRAYVSEILANFQSSSFGGTKDEHQEVEKLINNYEQELADYHDIINTSSKELNLCISANYLKMVSSVRVAPSVNVKLYLVIALVFFLVVGCCGAIVLGRLSDIVDYLLYTDKKSGLPNREKLNVYISSMADKILPEDFTCFTLQLDNLSELTKRFGYTVGDGVLKDFSGLVHLMGDTDGMIGYNDAGKFMAFFDECSDKKAAVIIQILRTQVKDYNKLNPEYPIQFTATWATTSASGTYEIRELLRTAQKKMSELQRQRSEEAFQKAAAEQNSETEKSES